ncbi:uncharacterized protein LOC106171265 isoform X2 [Lingula anatina]|uniref:Uncharacterized protein LOC106171265 isoform X2 n=1 Tax=Lingula anatina TaxID=7574 RepID=A0A1S3J9K3_LINAN|nr:uncharacterized protein LOC106171265 isoform X2 [Lingula anatina]|eukprot:XP_013406998.1 uncharacterized protein LOC106171265 isoform X2 [Lingula anatina]
MWKAAIHRKDITSEEKWDRTFVCSKHFVGGHTSKMTTGSTKARYQRYSQRGNKRKVSDAISSLLTLKTPRFLSGNMPLEDDMANSDIPQGAEEAMAISEESDPKTCEIGTQTCDKGIQTENMVSTTEIGTQTDLTSGHIEQIENDNNARVAESTALKKYTFSREGLYRFAAFENDDKKVSFYTGLPDLETL